MNYVGIAIQYSVTMCLTEFTFKLEYIDMAQLYDDATPEVDDGLDWICPLPPRAKRTVKIPRSNWYVAKCF